MPTVFALLTEKYEIEDSSGQKKMRTIEIKTYEGNPLMILQSENNRFAIESTLRNNGWMIVSWAGDNLQLTPIQTTFAPIGFATSPGPVIMANNPPPKKNISVLGWFLIWLFVINPGIWAIIFVIKLITS